MWRVGRLFLGASESKAVWNCFNRRQKGPIIAQEIIVKRNTLWKEGGLRGKKMKEKKIGWKKNGQCFCQHENDNTSCNDVTFGESTHQYAMSNKLWRKHSSKRNVMPRGVLVLTVWEKHCNSDRNAHYHGTRNFIPFSFSL